MNNLTGVNPPVVTLFKEDGSLDLDANKKLADFLIEKGVDGLAYLGTSGEFSILTMEEKKRFLKEMTEYVDHRVNVIAGIGGTCIEEVIELGNFAESIKADAVLLVNPYFSIYEEKMVEAYYDKVAESIKLPIIIYNFPDLTGFQFDFDLIRRLALRHENIIGVKDTVPDAAHIRKLLDIKKEKPEFRVFAAYENQALGSISDGVDGLINATVNFAPEFTTGFYKAYKSGDMKTAIECFEKMCDAMKIYSFSVPLFLSCKQAVYDRVLHHNCGERLPAVPFDEERRQAIHKELVNLGLV